MSKVIIKSAPSAPAELVRAAVTLLTASGKEPSPENLLRAAEKKTHPLHAFFYETPDETWIKFGRYEAARRLIDSYKVEFTHGGKSFETRAVEFIRLNGGGRWATAEEIAASPELRAAYAREVESLMAQAQAKMAKLAELMQE